MKRLARVAQAVYQIPPQHWQQLGLEADLPQSWPEWEVLCRRGGELVRLALSEVSTHEGSAARRRRERRASKSSQYNVQ